MPRAKKKGAKNKAQTSPSIASSNRTAVSAPPKIEYSFTRPGVDAPQLLVTLQKDLGSLGESYGLYAWPSSRLLAQCVAEMHCEIKGMRILELGCGIALPGIVAAKCGALVTLTDTATQPQILQKCATTALLNQVSCDVVALTWGEFPSSTLLMSPPDLLLGADVFYDADKFDMLLASVVYLAAPLLTVFHCRDPALRSRLISACAAWNLTCLPQPLSEHTLAWLDKVQLPHQLEIFRITQPKTLLR
jgi:predicted nicotinamide N-methyase